MSILSPSRTRSPALTRPRGHRPDTAVPPTTGTGSRAQFRSDIQGLRAVAVTLVVLYHCGVGFLGGGYVGVDVFFVISGFLITTHLVREVEETGRVSLRAFWARRVRRLLPPALLVIAVTVVAARLWGPVLESTRTARDGLVATFYAMNYHLAGQGIDYQQADAAPSPLQHFWSLAVEEQFYLLWPIIVLLVALAFRRAPRVARRVALLTVVVIVVALSLRESAHVTGTNPPLAYFSLQTRAWELGIGAAVALVAPVLAHRRFPGLLAAALAWTGLLAILVAAVAYDESTPFPGTLALVPVLGAALVVAGGCRRPAGGVEALLDNRPTQLVGNVSYGWYLWHWPLIVLAPTFWGFSFGTLENIEMAVVALWLALLSYLVVERPVLRRRVALGQAFALGLAASLLTALTAGGAIATQPAVRGPGAPVAAASAANQSELTSELRSALDTRPLPANLEPSLTRAGADVPRTSRDGCHLDFLEVDQPACTYGDRAADKTILLLGDSHAEQWFGALDRYAETRGFRLVSWTKVACPLADLTLLNEQLGRDYTECDQWRQERLAAIDELHPDLVVVSQADSLLGASSRNQEWASATASTVRAVTAPSRTVVFLGDTPGPGSSVPTCLARHQTDVGQCDVLRGSELPAGNDFAAAMVDRRHAVEREMAMTSAVSVDTQKLTCVRDRCPAVVGSTLVYRDDSHLTQWFVRSIAPVLAAALDSALAAPATGKDTP